MSELAKSPHYRADIQGLRGLAVLLVVLYHAGLPVPGGFIGVDVFFVLSGYVITDGIVRSLENGTFSFREFYAKRVRRLLPALTVMLTTVVVLSPLLGPLVSLKVSGRTGVAAALFNANHYLLRGQGYFDPSTEYNLFLHTWSLAVEEQFYMIFPLFLFLVWKLKGRSHISNAGIAIALVSLVSLAASLFLSYSDRVLGFNGGDLAFYTMLSRAWQFGVGALCVLFLRRGFISPTAAHGLSIAGVIGMVVSAFVIHKGHVFPGVAALLPTISTGMALAGLGFSASSSIPKRFLANRGLVRLGDLSYSWYLWHWPLIVIACANFPAWPLQASIVAAVLSLGVAALSERYVESPIRFRRESERLPITFVAAMCILLPVAGFAVQLGIISKIDEGGRNLAEIPALIRDADRSYARIGCDGNATWPSPARGCEWGDSGPVVLLVGDSNARQLIPMLSELVPSLDAKLVGVTKSACPFVDMDLVRDGAIDTSCSIRNREMAEGIALNRPDVVIIANAADDYIERSDFDLIPWRVAEDADQTNSKEAIYRDAIRATVKNLQSLGIKVVLVDPIPKFVRIESEDWISAFLASREHALLQRCSTLGWFVTPERCNLTRHLNDDIWRSSSYGERLHGDLGVNRVDSRASLCPNMRCEAYNGKGSLYHNATHIAPYGALITRPAFEPVLREVLESVQSR